MGFVGFTDIKSEEYKAPFGKKIGYQIFLEQPLAKPISLGIGFSSGKIYGSQTIKGTDINFQTTLMAQSLRVSYNLFPIVKPNRTLQPYVGFGVGFVSFRSKGDYKDATGRLYSAYDTTETIQKDHKYETDLRQANLDRFGNYPQITFAIPYFAGVDIKLKKGLCARINLEYQQVFSDMLDNVSSVGLGARQGKKGYDNLLSISAGINYNLSYAEEDESQPKDIDNDGIADNKDRCDNTPKGLRVDKKGCPVDDNKNGTADYLEKGTQANQDFKNFQTEEKKRVAEAKEKAKQDKLAKAAAAKNGTNTTADGKNTGTGNATDANGNVIGNNTTTGGSSSSGTGVSDGVSNVNGSGVGGSGNNTIAGNDNTGNNGNTDGNNSNTGGDLNSTNASGNANNVTNPSENTLGNPNNISGNGNSTNTNNQSGNGANNGANTSGNTLGNTNNSGNVYNSGGNGSLSNGTTTGYNGSSQNTGTNNNSSGNTTSANSNTVSGKNSTGKENGGGTNSNIASNSGNGSGQTTQGDNKPSSRVKITNAGNTKSQFLKAIGSANTGGGNGKSGGANVGNPDYEKMSSVDLSGRLGRFAYADYNKDGVISVNEVTRIIDLFFDKDSPLKLTVLDVQDLIDFFFEQ